MIPFEVFIGICSGGLVCMSYFLVCFWREDRHPRRTNSNQSIRIAGEQVSLSPATRRVAAFSRGSSAREFLIEEPERELRPASGWRVFVNPTRIQARRAR